MKLEQATKDRIFRNAVLSLFIYVLPLILMFGTFYITGQRPWEKKKSSNKQVSSLTSKKIKNEPNN